MLEGNTSVYKGEKTHLVGLSHADRNLDKADEYLTQTFNDGITKLMLELPSHPAVATLITDQEQGGGFFVDLARRQLGRCEQIILGDEAERPIQIPKVIVD